MNLLGKQNGEYEMWERVNELDRIMERQKRLEKLINRNKECLLIPDIENIKSKLGEDAEKILDELDILNKT